MTERPTNTVNTSSNLEKLNERTRSFFGGGEDAPWNKFSRTIESLSNQIQSVIETTRPWREDMTREQMSLLLTGHYGVYAESRSRLVNYCIGDTISESADIPLLMSEISTVIGEDVGFAKKSQLANGSSGKISGYTSDETSKQTFSRIAKDVAAWLEANKDTIAEDKRASIEKTLGDYREQSAGFLEYLDFAEQTLHKKLLKPEQGLKR